MVRILVLGLLFTFNNLVGQLESSSLPILKINTKDTLEILDEPKTSATLSIIYDESGGENLASSTDYVFTSNIGIEIRGESTQSYPKKSYLLETWTEEGEDKDTSFLNFPSEEDFILYAPFADKSMMNNVLAMDIANKMGRYASRTRYVELILNDEYQGVYVIMEKIKRDKNRLAISKLKPEDTEGDQLTGGYVFRIDKGFHPGWKSKYKPYNGTGDIFFQYYYPDFQDLQAEQQSYIERYMDAFEDAMASPMLVNDKGYHYSDYINLRSFIDNFILVELAKNVDGYRLSTYFHKDRDSKRGRIVASPVWDYNFSFGNADYCEGDNVEGWMYYQCSGNCPFWWDKMLKDELFVNGLKCRWLQLREDLLSSERLLAWIDSTSAELKNPAERNFVKWPILGQYVWPNPFYFVQAQSYSAVIDEMKSFLGRRLEWMDFNMPGEAEDCSFYDALEDEPTVVNSEELHGPLKLSMYPNPTDSWIEIESDVTIQSLTLYDILGNKLDFKNIAMKNFRYDISEIVVPGPHVLSLNSGNEIRNEIILILSSK